MPPTPLSIKELKVNECVPGFNVTGYFTPVESDYVNNNKNNNTKKMAITIEDVGVRTFNAEFINDTKTQGWGKTSEDWYLGYYDNAWHKSSSPLGANDKPLSINSVDTDPRLIPSGSKLIVTTLPRPYNNTVFSADDVDTSTNGKQITIYMGEGKLAEDKISKISENDNIVCLVSQS
jgi:3D (Asp-Asp-Asp) domain-containing protein